MSPKGFHGGQIGEKFEIPMSTVQHIVDKWENTDAVVNRHRQGRKRHTTSRQDTAIVRKVRMNPGLSAQKIASQVKSGFGINLHPSTIQRRPKSVELSGEIAKKKTWFPEKNRKKR